MPIKYANLVHNPYPDYTDCDDAFADLCKEVLEIDVPKAVSELSRNLYPKVFHERVEYQRPSCVKVLTEACRELASLQDVDSVFQWFDSISEHKRAAFKRAREVPDFRSTDKYQEMLMWDDIYYHAVRLSPPSFIMRDVAVIRDVEFVHTLPKARIESVIESGILGRATPRKLTLTRELHDVYLRGNGYIFAYDAEFYRRDEATVTFSAYILGKASHALHFIFEPDSEPQMLVPVKCIESFEIFIEDSPFRNYLDSEWGTADSHTLDATYWLRGTIRECTACGADFPLSIESLEYAPEVLCENCLRDRSQ